MGNMGGAGSTGSTGAANDDVVDADFKEVYLTEAAGIYKEARVCYDISTQCIKHGVSGW